MKPLSHFWMSCLAGTTLLLTIAGCHSPQAKHATTKPAAPQYPTLGSIQRLDPRLDALLAPAATIEKLAEGFDWSEGPVWMRQGQYLLFSDVPRNKVYRWQAGKEVSVFLDPSGYTGATPRGGEPGSNGLTTDSAGRLVLCQHGDRRISRLEPNGKQTILAQYHKFYRFNSPNDLVYSSKGDLYFTDPPYGLLGKNDDPAKELPFNGVFKLNTKGEVSLLTRDLTFPNGVALSPDEKTLFVAVSDPKNPVIMAYDFQADGSLGNERVFFNCGRLAASGLKGLPDGLKVDRNGNLFATGPGGVLVIAPDGTHLGTIMTGEATANCGWGNDGSMLYITADMYLLRIQTKTKGKGW